MRNSGAGMALQSYSAFWQGGRPLNPPIGQPLDVGYPWGVGIALGETAPSGGELCPGGNVCSALSAAIIPSKGRKLWCPLQRILKGHPGGASWFLGLGRGEEGRRGKEQEEKKGNGMGREEGGRLLSFIVFFSLSLPFPTLLFPLSLFLSLLLPSFLLLHLFMRNITILLKRGGRAGGPKCPSKHLSQQPARTASHGKEASLDFSAIPVAL